ncbi:MAG: LPS export ABC transporter ATP-binding protein [Planctomycetota bacterium]
MSLLQARNLVKIYARRKVVDGVSFSIERGEIVGLLGPNGAGKTTTFRMTVGMIPCDDGRIVFDGRDLARLPMYKRARLGLGYLSQEPSVFRQMSVRANLLAIMELTGVAREERHRRAGELLTEMGLSHLERHGAATLSGGERRRLEIARTLATNPRLILLDEPFSGIDPIAVADLQSILDGLRKKGIGILITDHAVRETLATTDRSYIIVEGHILCQGTPDRLAKDPDVRRLYLGKTFSLG